MFSPKEFFVIDANGFLHRNYHALPKLATSRGEEVGALYGFVNWLIKFMKTKRPQYAAVCFDSKWPTFRHNIYKEYKANRPPTDKALVSQLETAREIIAALGFKVMAEQGFEADDLMASAAMVARGENMETVLVTSDKDIYQIIGGGVKMWSGSKDEKYKDNESCFSKFGVNCANIADYLSIVGDSSDNVPGIAGLGPKAAVELITNFGTLEEIIKAAQNADKKIKPAVVQKIIAGKQSALLSKRLVMLKDDLTPDLKMSDFKIAEPRADKILAMAERFEFKNLLAFARDFIEQPLLQTGAHKPEQGDLFERERQSAQIPEAEFEDILREAKITKEIFLHAQNGFMVFAASSASCALIETAQITPSRQEALFSAISDDDILKIGHDIKSSLKAVSFVLSPPAFINCFDTALAKYCADPSGDFSIDGVFSSYLNINAGAQNERDGLRFYAANIWRLKENLQKVLIDNNQFDVFTNMETPLISVLLNIEINGIMVDIAWLKTLEILFSKEMTLEQEEINKIAGGEINVNSPKQLGALLFEQLRLPSVKKIKSGYSTDEESLSRLKNLHPVAEHILKYRESAKLKSTYVDALLNLADGSTRRVHTNFNQTGTVTGRLSSSSPNLQNIPIRTERGRLIRRSFIAPEGKVLLSVDYSQIDLRVLTHESGDENLIKAFGNNADIHTQTAAEVFGQMPQLVTKEMRSRAKAINFGIVYGQGPLALSQFLDISVREAKEYIDAYFARYSKVKEWIDAAAAAARKAGYVKTLFGHIRYLPEFESSSARLASFANRASVNTIVQGGSSDIIKKAMIDIYKEMPADVLMLLQVHDELVFEVPQEKTKETALWIKNKMENAVKLKVPLIAEVKAGKNWNEMGKVL